MHPLIQFLYKVEIHFLQFVSILTQRLLSLARVVGLNHWQFRLTSGEEYKYKKY